MKWLFVISSLMSLSAFAEENLRCSDGTFSYAIFDSSTSEHAASYFFDFQQVLENIGDSKIELTAKIGLFSSYDGHESKNSNFSASYKKNGDGDLFIIEDNRHEKVVIQNHFFAASQCTQFM